MKRPRKCPDLPKMVKRGMEVSLQQMTQKDLRRLIPQLLKIVSNDRRNISWKDQSKKPEWWPDIVIPWAHLKKDNRTRLQKDMMKYTEALREVVRCCYAYYEKEHLLGEEENLSLGSYDTDTDNSSE